MTATQPPQCSMRSAIVPQSTKEVPLYSMGQCNASLKTGVLVGSALPWTAWITEVDLEMGRDRQFFVLGKLRTTVPRQTFSDLLRKLA